MRGSVARQRARDTVAAVTAQQGYDLEDLRIVTAGQRQVLHLVVDRDAGLDLDSVAELSRCVSQALDAAEPFGDAAYVLEVSSPGVDRPLSEPRHWRRSVGRLVKVPLRAGGTVTGRICSADERGVLLLVAGGEQHFGYEQLGRGQVQVEFDPAKAPG